MKKLFIPIVASLLLVFGCDKIDHPIQGAGETGEPTTELKRRVLIEEFTGQLCSACPEGAREIERLVGVLGDQLIPISVHAGSFANNGPNAAEFTTTAGDDLNNTFGVVSWPAGVVSRVNNATVYGRFQWESEINNIKNDAPIAEVTITNSYNTSTKDVSIQVDTEWLEDGGTDNYKLQVYIIEDHIIAFQIDGTLPQGQQNVANYDHRHMLRGAVNTSWGTAIPVTTAGTTDTQNFNFTLAPTWDEANCEVIAFIYKDGPNYEVMQANIAHVE